MEGSLCGAGDAGIRGRVRIRRPGAHVPAAGPPEPCGGAEPPAGVPPGTRCAPQAPNTGGACSAASQAPDEGLRWLWGGSRGILVKTGSANNGSGDLPHQSGGRGKRDGKRNGIYGKGGGICAQPSGLCAPGRGKSAGAGRFYGKPDRGYGLRDGHPVGGAFKPGL